MFDPILLLVAALVAAALPAFLPRTDRALHGTLALSTGIFLGAVFLHLLPMVSHLAVELREHAGQTGHEHHGHAADVSPWFFVLVGVLAVYLSEVLFLGKGNGKDRSRHRTVGYAALLGLSVHAFVTGVGLGVTRVEGDGHSLLIAMVAHKAFEAFSLSTVLQLAAFQRRTWAKILIAFALVTPAGMLLGQMLADDLPEYGVAVLTALAAGTFLYVALCELLPEVFHRDADRGAKITLIWVGVALTYAIEILG